MKFSTKGLSKNDTEINTSNICFEIDSKKIYLLHPTSTNLARIQKKKLRRIPLSPNFEVNNK